MGDALAPAPRSSFRRFWAAATIRSIGSAVTAVAMPVLVVQLLGANSNCPTDLRYYAQLIAAYPSGPAPDVGASVNVTPTRYNGMPALRWNNLQPYCLTY